MFNVNEAGPILLDPGCFPAGMGMLEPSPVGLGLGWCCLVSLVVPGFAHPEHPSATLGLPLSCWSCPLVPSICLFPCCLFFLIPKSTRQGTGLPLFLGFAFFTCSYWVFLYFKSNLAGKREVSSPGVSRSAHLLSCLGAIKPARSRNSSFQLRHGDFCLHPCLPLSTREDWLREDDFSWCF